MADRPNRKSSYSMPVSAMLTILPIAAQGSWNSGTPSSPPASRRNWKHLPHGKGVRRGSGG
eukprot:1194981-Prorocentrum_minimum.AAC.3